MTNFLLKRKLNERGQGKVYIDSAELFFNKRKLNDRGQVYYADIAEYFYNKRKLNPREEGQTFVLNLPPVVDNPIPDQAVVTNQSFDFTFAEDTFSDPEAGPLTYTATKGDDSPLPAWLTFTAVLRRFVGTPDIPDAEVLAVKVTAEDDQGATVSDTFNIDVILEPVAPVVDQGILDQATDANGDFNFQFPADAFFDANGDVLTYTAKLTNGQPLPTWLTLDPNTRTFSGVPVDSDIGGLEIKVTADDGTA